MHREITEELKVKGRVVIEVREVDTGKVVQREEVDNLVVNVGKAALASALTGKSIVVSTFVASSDTVAVSANDTTIPSQLGSVAITQSYTSGSPATTANFVVFVSSSQLNGTWNKIGLFLSGGTLFAEANISTVSKTTALTATVTWSVTLS